MRVFFAAGEGYTVSKIEVRSDPAPSSYRTSRTSGTNGRLRSVSFESLSLPVEEVLV
jgi:hypothetical protein